jgi:hypothetical protein
MRVRVEAIFSKNKLLGSKFICKATKHLAKKTAECSHVALLINGRWVHESTMKQGLRVISIVEWSKTNTIVDKITIGLVPYYEVANLYRELKNKKYDWFGVLYLALSILTNLIGDKMTADNRWQSEKRYFCCEVLGKFMEKYYGMMTPIQILADLRRGCEK